MKLVRKKSRYILPILLFISLMITDYRPDIVTTILSLLMAYGLGVLIDIIKGPGIHIK